jgi:hypothetical protein
MVLPLLDSLTQQNVAATKLIELLQTNNFAAEYDCDYLETAVNSWVNMAVKPQPPSLITTSEDTFVLWAQLLPSRCGFQREDGVITSCKGKESLLVSAPDTCRVWDAKAPASPDEATESYFARELNLRLGVIRIFFSEGYDGRRVHYNATVIFNQNPTVALA